MHRKGGGRYVVKNESGHKAGAEIGERRSLCTGIFLV